MAPKKTQYPNPLVIPPLSGAEHTHTFILLHGRGSNAERFGLELLRVANLSARLPTTKFIFPTASRRRSTLFKRLPIHQWFDIYSLEDPDERPDLQIEGLTETAGLLRRLIDTEAKVFGDDVDGYKRIILGGLSQGCAAGVFAMLGGLLEDGATKMSIGGFVGMSGWLPFNGQLAEIFESFHTSSKRDDSSDNIEFDPFDNDGCDTNQSTPELETINHVRDILDLPMLTFPAESPNSSVPIINPASTGAAGVCKPKYQYLHTPVFLGHGSDDEKVSVRLGQSMADFLSGRLGMDVIWKIYEGFGHWYKVPDEIDDIVLFLKEKAGVLVG